MFKNFTIILCFLFQYTYSQKRDYYPLEGTWKFNFDTTNIEKKEKWYVQKFNDSLTLPGSLRDYNKGYEPDLNTPWTGSIYDSSWYFNPKMKPYRKEGDMKFPFWLTPDKHYVGKAWYKKEIVINDTYRDKLWELVLERPHWQTKVWIDHYYLGSGNSLSTPHRFYIETGKVKKGKHTIIVMVDNKIRNIDPGINSHSITDHTQGNWNGITGKIYLNLVEKIGFESIKVTPDVAEKKVDIDFTIRNNELSKKCSAVVTVQEPNSTSRSFSSEIKIHPKDSVHHIKVSLGDEIKLWDEFSPELYDLNIILIKDTITVDSRNVQFGMKDFIIEDKSFYINSRPLFLRGTTECCVFPETGYPPADEEEWIRVFKICKSFGLNHIRFHSYCPPEAAFNAADKTGIYLQVEGPSWAKYSTSLGYNKPIDKYLYEETIRILKEYGNHPSFCLMAYGNEPSGKYVQYLNNWVEFFKEYDPRVLYTGASTGKSWKIIDSSEFIVRAAPRGLQWKNKAPESIFDYSNRLEDQNKPYITFEMGQWCAFPNFEEIPKYTGPLKAKNFEIFQQELNNNHLGNLANEFLMASGKLQLSCYKQEIEATLRTDNLSGFQLLSLNDFPGQGTALVGVLDAFWEEKGYCSATDFKHFCNDVVPLIRLSKFVYTNNDTIKVKMEAANFSSNVLEDATVYLRLIDSMGRTVACEKFKKTILLGNCIDMGHVNTTLFNFNKPEKLKIEFQINDFINNWNIWVFPHELKMPEPKKFIITDTLDQKIVKYLSKGGKVLLLCSGKVEQGKEIIQYQTPVFWNTSWFRMRPPHTTGIFIRNEHPVFKDFVTEFYSENHWWEIANRQQIMCIDNLPSEINPIIQPIDTWFLNRRLAMLFETKVGKGSIMLCSISFDNLDNKPVARQLLYSIINYLNSKNFNPQNEVNIDKLQDLFIKP